QDVGNKRRCRGFPMRTRHRYGSMALCDQSEYLRTLHQCIPLVPQVIQFLVVLRDSRRINDQGSCLIILHFTRNVFHTVDVVHVHSFGSQFICQFRLGSVIPRHADTFPVKPPGQRTHTNPANAQEVNVMVLPGIHFPLCQFTGVFPGCCTISFSISLSISRVAFGLANEAMLWLSISARLSSNVSFSASSTRLFMGALSPISTAASLSARARAVFVW